MAAEATARAAVVAILAAGLAETGAVTSEQRDFLGSWVAHKF